jgi:hypothetical protein
MEENEYIKPFLPCKHNFHRVCLEPWTQGHAKCPYCSTEDPAIVAAIIACEDALFFPPQRGQFEDHPLRGCLEVLFRHVRLDGLLRRCFM